MAEGDPTQLDTLTHALQQLLTGRDGNGEPYFGCLFDPPGSMLIQSYIHQHPHPAEERFLYVELPSPNQRPSGKAWLLKVLLHAAGDTNWDKREEAFAKELRLKHLLRKQTELVVLANLQHLGMNQKANREFEGLLSIFQTGEMMPLVVIGDQASLRHIIGENPRFAWRFPLLLSSEDASQS